MFSRIGSASNPNPPAHRQVQHDSVNNVELTGATPDGTPSSASRSLVPALPGSKVNPTGRVQQRTPTVCTTTNNTLHPHGTIAPALGSCYFGSDGTAAEDAKCFVVYNHHSNPSVNRVESMNVPKIAPMYKQLYAPAGSVRNNRFYCNLPPTHPPTLHKRSDAFSFEMEFKYPTACLTQTEFAAVHQHMANCNSLNPNPTVYLNFDVGSIKEALLHHFDKSVFDHTQHHAIVCGIEVVKSVNSTLCPFRAEFQTAQQQVYNTSSQYKWKAYASPQGLCSKPIGSVKDPSVLSNIELYQYGATLASQSRTQGVPSDKYTMYTIDDDKTSKSPEFAIMSGLGECEIVRDIIQHSQLIRSEIQSVGKEPSRDRLRIKQPRNELQPENIAQYLMISHENEVIHFSAAEQLDRPTVMTPSDGNSTGDFDVSKHALLKCALQQVKEYGKHAIDLTAPMRIALTAVDGSRAWDDMLVNASRTRDRNDPVDLRMTLKMTILPYVSKNQKSDEHKAELVKLFRQVAEDARVTLNESSKQIAERLIKARVPFIEDAKRASEVKSQKEHEDRLEIVAQCQRDQDEIKARSLREQEAANRLHMQQSALRIASMSHTPQIYVQASTNDGTNLFD